MAQALHPVQSFIDAKGGPAKVAAATGFNPNAVALWRHRKIIPRSAWPEIIKGLDVTLDDLLAIETASRAQAQDQAA